ncbi:MAG: histidinol dehydrogenase, partial [Thermoplasmata archaeon]|nr:histidinol dehydrogenase [Thermoplasmata archaeon]
MLKYTLSRMTSKELRSVLEREDVDLTSALSSAMDIIDQVRANGDEALLRFSEQFEGFRSNAMRISESELVSAQRRLPKLLLQAIKRSKARIEKFHSKQTIRPFEYEDDCGIIGQRVVPLERVGVYVPGGTASYASSVLMACIPAKISGVKEIVLCTPGRSGKVADPILAAAGICGINEVYSVGGAQAVAAMAYGTETIRRVQKIVGPGGAFVTAAKLLVRNDCEIDFLAGPSEVLLIADDHADPRFIAMEMLAQLEHDPLARAVLVTDSKKMIESSSRILGDLISTAARKEIVDRSSSCGAIFIKVKSVNSAVEFSNSYAPEHLVIDVRNPKKVLKSIYNAGSVFLGPYSSVAFGDYCTGTNHILPTKGVAAMKSSLSTYDFVKIVPYQMLTRKGASKLSETVRLMA